MLSVYIRMLRDCYVCFVLFEVWLKLLCVCYAVLCVTFSAFIIFTGHGEGYKVTSSESFPSLTELVELLMTSAHTLLKYYQIQILYHCMFSFFAYKYWSYEPGCEIFRFGQNTSNKHPCLCIHRS